MCPAGGQQEPVPRRGPSGSSKVISPQLTTPSAPGLLVPTLVCVWGGGSPCWQEPDPLAHRVLQT